MAEPFCCAESIVGPANRRTDRRAAEPKNNIISRGARVSVLPWHLFPWRRLAFQISPLSAGQSMFAVLAVLLQVVLSSAEAAPPSPSPHVVVRNVGEILVWVEKNEDKSDGGLIKVEAIRANLAKLLTELLKDRSADISIRQDQSTGLPFSPLIQLAPGLWR
jgi:hypothetical protein